MQADPTAAPGALVCSWCEAPATHAFTGRWNEGQHTFCECCARESSAHDRGQVYVALKLLELAIAELEEAGLTEEEILDTCRATVPGDTSPTPAWAQNGFGRSSKFPTDTRFVRLPSATDDAASVSA